MTSPWSRARERIISMEDRVLNNVWIERSTPSDRRLRISSNTVIPSDRGSAIIDAVVDIIRDATEVLVIGSFLIGSQDVVKEIHCAWDRGVRTYLLTSSLEQLKANRRRLGDDEWADVQKHQRLLDDLWAVAMIRSAPFFHAKFLLTDPWTRGRGLILTSNLRDGAMRDDHELAVVIDADETRRLADAVRWSFWEDATHQLAEPGRIAAVKPLGTIEWSAPGGSVLTATRWGKDITEASLRLLGTGGEPIIASSHSWHSSHPVVEHLCELARSGTSVTVLANPMIRDQIETMEILAASGARVLGRERLHAKALTVGKKDAIVHTTNYSTTEEPNLDVGVVLDRERAGAVHQVMSHWAASVPFEFVSRAQLKDVGQQVILANSGGKMKVEDVHENVNVDLGTVVADSADELDVTPALDANADVLARTVTFSWEVEAPVLETGAKPAGSSDERGHARLFREARRLVVVVENPDELDYARELRTSSGAEAIVVTKRALRERHPRG